MPEPPLLAVAVVDVDGVATVRFAQRAGHGVGFAGDDDHVDVVWHEAVGQYFYVPAGAGVRHEPQVFAAVIGREEYLPSLFTALGDQVGLSGEHYACDSSHGGSCIRSFQMCK